MNALRLSLLPLALLALTTGACGKEESKPTNTTESANKEPEKKSEAPAKTDEKKSGLELFSGSEVALPEPIAKLAFKMPIEEAAKHTPTLVGEGKKYGPLEGFAKAKAIISLTKGDTHLRSFVFMIENSFADLTAHLDKIWGPSVEVTSSGGKKKRYWTNTKAGLRMYGEESGGGGSRVVFEQVMSFDDFVGSEKGKFGFEKIPLLGASEEDVRKAYAAELIGVAQKEGKLSIAIPAHEFTEYGVFLTLTPENGAIKEWQFSVSYSIDKAAQESLLAKLDEKFGPGKKGQTYTDFKGPPTVKLGTSIDQNTFWIK